MASSNERKERRDLRLEVANHLIERIESGTAPWQRPWEAGAVLAPVNAVTGKPYRGVNYQNLMMFSPDLSDPRWCTYKQAQEQGWQVREGSGGLPIEVWKEYERKRTEEELENLRQEGADNPAPTERRLGVRYYTVFHASQIDGIPPLERPERNHEVDGNSDPRLDGLAEAMGIEVRRGGDRVFYRPGEDFVQMPNAADFHTAAGHDTTFLHELSHATGHPNRLNREFGKAFGDQKYAIEELRAEMSAAMTAASLGIGFDPEAQNREEGRELGNSAAYLASWLGALPEKERKQTLMQAIKDAQGISDYLIARTPERQAEQELVRPTVARGDYVRYRNEIGQEQEGVVLDDAQPGEATRLRHITRWSNGVPRMDEADHIMSVVLPDVLDMHLVSAVRDVVALNGVDSRTKEYKLTMGSDMERRKMENRVLMEVERARGVYPTFSRETDSLSPDLQEKGRATLDPDLIAHLRERQSIRNGEHPNWSGLSDSVANAQEFVRQHAQRFPELAEKWAADLRGNPFEYGEALGLESDNVRGIATQMEQSVHRIRHPQLSDLVRFEPYEPGVTSMPFSGRVIAALDTHTGDVRYHLRAETGPDQGIEARVYGRDGQFRGVDFQQAVGFDRALAPELPPMHRPEDLREEQAIQEYQAFYAQLPEREEKLVTEVRERSARLAPADFQGFSEMMRDFSKGVDDTFGTIREGEDRGASAPELRLAWALATEDISDLPAVKTAREQARRLGERFHDLSEEVRGSFRERLQEHGKALLESGTLHEPREIVQATYWKHGIEANPDNPMIGKMTDAIRDKDLGTLLGMIGHNGQNPASEEAFSRLTGVPLGKTQRERVAQLREWAGPERVTALEQTQAEQTHAREEARKVRSLSSAWENLQHLRVNMGNDRVLAGPAYVAEKVSDGKDHIVSRKEGAVTAYYLVHRETGELAGVRKDRFTAFAKGVLALDPEGDVRKAMERAGLSQHLPPVERQESQDPSRSAEKTPVTPRHNSYEEKQKARQERYRALAEKMQLRAQARLDQAHRMAETIPFGQPILVGHHSERRDRRFRERIHNTFGSGFALLEKAQHYERRALGVNTHAISGDDPEALEKLKVRVETLKAAQERMKAANATIRKHQKDGPEAQQAALESLGFKPEQATSLLTPDVMGTVGFASCSLSNRNANIRRLEERIQTLEKARKLEDRETRHAWGLVRENKEINRIQFRFEDKPDEETRKLMKTSGFRWAPSEQAWQRQWTGNAVGATRALVKQLDERLAPDQNASCAEPAARISPPGSAPVRAAEFLAQSLETLKHHEITLPGKEGGGRTFNARQYLEDGLRRGFTVIEDSDGTFRWQGKYGSRGRTVTDEKLIATFQAATAVDKDIGRAIRSVERQKADLEWER